MKKYTDTFFIQQAQWFYQVHHRVPKTRDFSWGNTALRRFGSWETFLKAAYLLPKDQEMNDSLKRKKKQLWMDLLKITYKEDWVTDEFTVLRVRQLREEMEKLGGKS